MVQNDKIDKFWEIFLIIQNVLQNFKNFHPQFLGGCLWFLVSFMNKTEHAVHIYAAGKGWIHCNTKNVE